jgi:branched-chain amino acid aminotransferase
VNINGRITGRAGARISVFDRGFLYGDSVYEVLRTYGGAPFALREHLARLRRSGRILGMRIPQDGAWMARELVRTLRAARNRESYVRVIVTRGAGPVGLDPALAEDPLTIFIAQELHPPPAELYERGARVELVHVSRAAEGSLDPAAKSGNYLQSVLALREARARGAYEAIMLNRRGRLCEGSTSNLFVVQGRRLVTPPLSAGILEGITRRHVMRIARRAGLSVEERDLAPADLRFIDEAFITSSIREIMPVTRVGHHPGGIFTVGDGRPGPVTCRLRDVFREHAQRAALAEWHKIAARLQ